MALPTSCGYYFEPSNKGPRRDWYQAYKSGGTQGAMIVLGTVTAKSFHMQKLAVTIYDKDTAAGIIEVKTKNDVFMKLNANTNTSYVFDFGPVGVKSGVADTATCELNITTASCGAACFVSGYFE